MVNDADGSEYPTHAVYDEVRPPELLVWTEPGSGMRVTSEFVALGPDRTEVRIHQLHVPEAPMATDEAQAGFLSSLDRFAAYLAGIVRTPTAPGTARTEHGAMPWTNDDRQRCMALVAEEYARPGRPSRGRRPTTCGTRRRCARAGAPARSWRT